MKIEPFHPDHLPQLKDLINIHFGAVIPGWSLTSDYIAKHLERNPAETLTDSWVIERKTLVVIHKQHVIAAAHLLRYGTGETVGENYQNMGEIGWLLAYPHHYDDQTKALLTACHDQMRAWNVAGVMVAGGLWFPVCSGIPHVWEHITTALADAGYKIGSHKEAVYGGWLNGIPQPGPSPVEGVVVQRRFRDVGVSFMAYLGDEEIGECEVEAELTDGNERPSLMGWGELASMHVNEEWRSRGIGSWLVQHAVEWLRMAGCSRIVLAVLAEDEERGAGRFYNRFGWQPFTRELYYEPQTLQQLDMSAK